MNVRIISPTWKAEGYGISEDTMTLNMLFDESEREIMRREIMRFYASLYDGFSVVIFQDEENYYSDAEYIIEH